MDYFRTQYEKCYEGEEYYWGLEPAAFLDDLLKTAEKAPADLKVLDIGCGEGKDAVYMAQQGCKVSAFDITQSGIRKTKLLAEKRGVSVDAFVADINDFEINDKFYKIAKARLENEARQKSNGQTKKDVDGSKT